MNFLRFLTLSPEVKVFIISSAIIGPISIATLLYYLKQIEKRDPERIRWK